MSSSTSSTSRNSTDPYESSIPESTSRRRPDPASLPITPNPPYSHLSNVHDRVSQSRNQQTRDGYTVNELLMEDAAHPSQSEQYSEQRRQAIIAMDRKRRLTDSTHDGGRRRTHSGGFHERQLSSSSSHGPLRLDGPSSPNNRMRSGSSQVARSEVIDLTGSSPELHSRPLPAPPEEASVDSAPYTLPRWQPDSEVSECPICRRQFSFLFRRHHCRKCGRVVCSDCSPHRITIPRQFIVPPPGPSSSRPVSMIEPVERVETIDLTAEDEDHRVWTRFAASSPTALAWSGGEKVRLCNPCVPDPQPSPIPAYSPPELLSPGEIWRRDQGLPPLDPNRHSADVLHRTQLDWQRAQERQRYRFGNSQPESGSNHRSQQARHIQQDVLQRYGNFDYHSQTDDPRRPGRLPLSSNHHPPGTRPPSFSRSEHSESTPSRNRQSTSYQLPGHSRFLSMEVPGRSSLPGSRPRGSSMFDAASRNILEGPSSSSSSRPLAAGPARIRLRESDICPICLRALPPKGSDGDETAREAHIMQCINSGMNSRQETSSSAPGGRQALMQIPSRAPVQMLPFVATEKDCLGEEGNPQECSICMEEYNVGDQLARLECLCRFHHQCIVEWFGRKQECPLHKIA